MKVLVDEQLAGMVPLLRSSGYEVISVKQQYPGFEDEKLVLIAKENGYVFVTEDSRAADAANYHEVPLVRIDLAFKAKSVHIELAKMKASSSKLAEG